MLEAFKLGRELLAAIRELTLELRARRPLPATAHHAECECNACKLGLPPGRAA